MVKHHPANLLQLTTVSGAMVVKCLTDLLYVPEPVESQVADEFDTCRKGYVACGLPATLSFLHIIKSCLGTDLS